jgi:transposase
VDAAHFTMLTGLGYLWSVMVCWVRSMAGRKRHSVLGALNAVTHQLVTVTTDATVNSDTMKELLSKLRTMIGETGTKTVIILDNARYQHCAAVKQWAEGLDITLEFLPGYSPHLNLIERVWKFIRKTTLNNRYFADFELWGNAIDGCVDDINSGKHTAALNSLLAWNFQTFSINKIIV